MTKWSSLIDEASLSSVLPDDYASFARPISNGLAVFLDGLPSDHQAEVLAAQLALPATASFSARLGALAQCCPVLHKLGQIVARDQRLKLELRQRLQELESLPPSVSFEVIQETLARELGPPEQLPLVLRPPALAEASVAVVIPFANEDPASAIREGVFKILKPGIRVRLDQELMLLERVGEHLDSRCDDLKIPHLDYQESFQQVRDKLRFEVRLDQEQLHLARAARVYVDEPRVQIPELLPYCTPQVTAMQRIHGDKITRHQGDSASARRRLAQLVVKALLAWPIFTREADALFHSDPHAGNLFLTCDGRLAILDWSLVGTLTEADRTAIVQILLGAVTLDRARITEVLVEVAHRQLADRSVLNEVVHRWLARVRGGQFPGLCWLVGMLDEAVQSARLRVPGELMMFRKSLHTLEGVVADLGLGREQIDEMLCLQFLRHFAWEWPRRWLALPGSRDFATRLSNADLAETILSWPWTTARYWLES